MAWPCSWSLEEALITPVSLSRGWAPRANGNSPALGSDSQSKIFPNSFLSLELSFPMSGIKILGWDSLTSSSLSSSVLNIKAVASFYSKLRFPWYFNL